MAEKIHYTRRDLKGPDEFISTFGRIVEWCKGNRSKVNAALFVLLATLVLSLGTSAYFRWQENKAGSDLWPHLEQARELLAAPAAEVEAGKLAAVESSISSLVKKHSGTRAAACGEFYLGSIAFHRGDYEGGVARFREGIRSGKAEGILALLLREGLARSLEAKGDYAGAAASYREAAEAAGPRMKTRLRFGEGRVLELSGKKTESASLYRKIIEENPDSRIKDLIDIKLSRME